MPILTDSKTWEIKVDGKSILDDYHFSDIRLIQEINRPNELYFNLRKKRLAETKDDILFKLSEKLLGKEVELSFTTLGGSIETTKKKDDNRDLYFKGIILDVSASRQSMRDSLVYNVTAFSPDYLLIGSPHCFSYEKETLKNIVANIIKPYKDKITIENKPSFEDEILYTVQYNENNYAFLNRLAIRYNQWFYYNGNELIFGKLKKNNDKPLELLPTRDILSYGYRVTTGHFNYTHNQHNYMNYENTNHSGNDYAKNAQHGMTKIALQASKDIFTEKTFQLLNGGIFEENSFDETDISAKTQTTGKMAQLMTCSGSSNRADLKIGSVFYLKEDYQNEKKTNTNDSDFCDHDTLLVIRVSHYLTNQGYYQNDFTAISAESEFPPYNYGEVYPRMESQHAVVIENIDPEKLGRVRVQFQWQKEQDEKMMTPWIRISTPYAGKDKGFYLIPEIKEEVMVGFENGNAEKPYVIGALYHGSQKPRPGWCRDENNNKSFRSRSGQTIQFQDRDVEDGENAGCIFIWDNPNENYVICFDSTHKLISMKCKGDIKLLADGDIVLSAGGNISASAKDINEEAKGNVSLKADGNYDISVGGNMDAGVKEFTLNSNTGIKLKASSTMKLESATHEQKASAFMKLDGGGMLEEKAGMIKIN